MKGLLFKIGVLSVFLALVIGSCKGTQDTVHISDQEKMAFQQNVGDTVKIVNDSTEYEIIIIDPGFDLWLRSIAKPEWYYTQSYMENRNRIYVAEWNYRVTQPQRYDSNLYEMQINYNPNIDYGLEVNYKLYYYFIYFQRKYNQRLGPFVPRV
ncbi:DUF6146 family protein [Flavobacteriaceae bacterium F89]|uniref:DUF6146 family protein n=1 Tax=Cerina litoralis TaxID=2874477 RepID=A0AAE3EYE4_9FLAO|nr:DUF6146 family protein [Cerina litoralis]MCG2461992.1 DUF6146 family protein [Cerina litoralis]